MCVAVLAVPKSAQVSAAGAVGDGILLVVERGLAGRAAVVAHRFDDALAVLHDHHGRIPVGPVRARCRCGLADLR